MLNEIIQKKKVSKELFIKLVYETANCYGAKNYKLHKIASHYLIVHLGMFKTSHKYTHVMGVTYKEFRSNNDKRPDDFYEALYKLYKELESCSET